MTTFKKDPIQFRPLTEGLGFHPFSDGLPYAPLGKSNKPQQPQSQPVTTQQPAAMGTGAMAAGPAKYNPQARPVAGRISVPVAQPSYLSPPLPVAPPPAPRLPHVTPKTPGQLAAEQRVQESFGLLYLFKRVLAYCMDTALNVTLSATALGAVFYRQDLNFNSLANSTTVVLICLFLLSFNWAMITAQETLFGTSIMKRLFGLELRGSTSQILWRAIFFLPSALLCGLGLIAGIFDGRKRCFHDHAVDLQPLEIAQL